VRERAPARSYLETAGQIEALLDAAGEMDREATRERAHLERRAMLSTMIYAGLRIGELCSLRWRDVDLAAGWLTVGESKTDAGRRRVKIRGALRDELLAARARRTIGQDAYVFPTRTGRRQYESKVRTATLGSAVKRANENLAARDLPPLPDKLTPHGLRRTFASVLYALGEPPPVVMAEMGHTSPALALKVYAQAMRRGEGEQAQLRALIEGAQLAVIGIRGENASMEHAEGRAA
jgi:integrase